MSGEEFMQRAVALARREDERQQWRTVRRGHRAQRRDHRRGLEPGDLRKRSDRAMPKSSRSAAPARNSARSTCRTATSIRAASRARCASARSTGRGCVTSTMPTRARGGCDRVRRRVHLRRNRHRPRRRAAFRRPSWCRPASDKPFAAVGGEAGQNSHTERIRCDHAELVRQNRLAACRISPLLIAGRIMSDHRNRPVGLT